MSADEWATRSLEQYQALAVVLVREMADGRVGIEWWQREAEGKVFRRWVTSPHGVVDATEVLAVQTAELAVAARDRQPVTPPPPVDRPPPEPEPKPEAPPKLPFWRARVGFGALGSPGGLGVMLQPSVGASLAFGEARRFGVAVDGSATVVRGRVDLDAVRRKIGIALVRTHAVWWIRPGRRVSPSLAVGGGAGIAWSGPAPRRQTVVGLVSVAPSLAMALSPRVAFAVGVSAAIAIPRFEVASGDRNLAVAGLPLLDGWAGIQIRG